MQSLISCNTKCLFEKFFQTFNKFYSFSTVFMFCNSFYLLSFTFDYNQDCELGPYKNETLTWKKTNTSNFNLKNHKVNKITIVSACFLYFSCCLHTEIFFVIVIEQSVDFCKVFWKISRIFIILFHSTFVLQKHNVNR